MLQYAVDRLGFTLIFIELVRRKCQMVAHCCILDWMFVFRNCLDDLPPLMSDFCNRLQVHFARIWDTKRMAVEASRFDSKVEIKLQLMFEYFKSAYNDKPQLLDTTVFAEELQHDAAYDASMTGYCFLHLSAILARLHTPLTASTVAFTFNDANFDLLMPELLNKLQVVFPSRSIDLHRPDEAGDDGLSVIVGKCGDLEAVDIETAVFDDLVDYVSDNHTV